MGENNDRFPKPGDPLFEPLKAAAEGNMRALRAELKVAAAEPHENAEAIDGRAFLARMKQRRG